MISPSIFFLTLSVRPPPSSSSFPLPFLKVKLSRERQRQKRQQHENLCDRRARENEGMESELQDMQNTIDFLVRAVGQPGSLAPQDEERLRSMVLEHKHHLVNGGMGPAERAAAAAKAAEEEALESAAMEAALEDSEGDEEY
jgi:hypothetical protein